MLNVLEIKTEMVWTEDARATGLEAKRKSSKWRSTDEVINHM